MEFLTTINNIESSETTKRINHTRNILHKTHKQDVLMETLIHYYFNNTHINIILDIFNGVSLISLRVIDWFVTNYSKKLNITYMINTDNEHNKKMFNVYLDYKQQLKGYSKKQFDPFCRRGRIQFYYNATQYITTTVGQLNFFKWAYDNNILEYITHNLTIIEKDMNDSYKHQYGKQTNKNKNKNKNKNLTLTSVNVHIEPKKTKRKKRHELSKSACKSFTKYNTRVTLRFD